MVVASSLPRVCPRAHPLDRLAVRDPAANRTCRALGAARAGLALALAIVLAASAVALLRRWPVAKVLVAMAAALLIRDAWFNVLTARQGHAAVALVVAAGLELPLAGLCLWVAVSYARAVTVARPYVPAQRRQTARADAKPPRQLTARR